MLRDFALRRLNLLQVDSPPGGDARLRLAFFAELAQLGYRVLNQEDYSDSLWQQQQLWRPVLLEKRGGQVDYVPLFQGFPERVPEDRAYFQSRLLGYLINFCPLLSSGPRLENGLVVPEWLFDLNDFGADPIFQRQDGQLFYRGKWEQQQRQGDEHTEWIDLQLCSAEEIRRRSQAWLEQALYAKSSIPQNWQKDIEFLLQELGTDWLQPERIEFREIRTYLLSHFWRNSEYPTVSEYVTTPTDLLRLMASLSDSDVSLARPIKYPKLRRAQRTCLMHCLENCNQLEEDLQRYRGLWLALGRGLHPGQLKKRFPRTAEAFRRLREEKIWTFQGHLERAFERGQASEALALLKMRPGLLARSLRRLLKSGQTWSDDLAQALHSVPLRTLLAARDAFRARRHRVIFNLKGQARRLPAHPADSRMVEHLTEVIFKQLAQRPPLGDWQVDPVLWTATLPLQMRSASPGALALGRGSRLPLDLSKVLRLFVYWKQHQLRTDLDLSVIQFDSNFNYQGHVSYTRLAQDGIVHSGDIQSAPHGAAEFIDIPLAKLKCRYLAPQIFRYAGDRFQDMTCQAGWMLRDKVDSSYQSFDIKTVQHKFQLQGQASYCLPMLIDLMEGQIIYLDLYLTAAPSGNRVEGALNDLQTLLPALAELSSCQTTVGEWLELHQKARGGNLHEPSGQRLNLDQGARLLSEFL